MRRFITFIALVLCLFANAQVKRNDNGEKMVSKISIYSKYKDTPNGVILFHYDKNDKLVKLIYEKFSSKEKRIYQKDGNIIKMTAYQNGNFDKNNTAKFELNNKNKIIFIEDRDYNIQNHKEFIKNTWHLEYDDYDRIYYMISCNFFAGTEEYCKEEDMRDITYYEWYNGNMYSSERSIYYWKKRDAFRRDEVQIRIEEDKYNQFENDTNIDFFSLSMNKSVSYTLPLMTEWSGFKTKNLFINNKSRFDYLSEDDEHGDNNIIEFHFYLDGGLSLRYELEYMKVK